MGLDSELLRLVQRGIIEQIKTISLDLPIHAIGTDFTRPGDFKYFELVNIPFDQAELWGTEERQAGQFNIILHWPVEGTGPYAVIELLEELATRLPKGHQFWSQTRCVQISQNPKIGAAVRGNYLDATGFRVADNGSETLTALAVPYSSFKP